MIDAEATPQQHCTSKEHELSWNQYQLAQSGNPSATKGLTLRLFDANGHSVTPTFFSVENGRSTGFMLDGEHWQLTLSATGIVVQG